MCVMPAELRNRKIRAVATRPTSEDQAKKTRRSGLGTDGRSAPKKWRERQVPAGKSQGEHERDNAGGCFVRPYARAAAASLEVPAVGAPGSDGLASRLRIDRVRADCQRGLRRSHYARQPVLRA